MTDEPVPLCKCMDLVQAQMIRSSLEARGVPAFIDTVNQRAVLGMLGAAIDLRVMVPRSQLPLARELASELIPDLKNDEEVDEDEELLSQPMSPSRRPIAEDLQPGDEEAEEEYEPPTRSRRKSIPLALIVGILFLSLGTLHLYMGKERTGGILLVTAAFGIGAIMGGQWWGSLVFTGVWLFDLIRGIVLILRHNAELDAAAPRAALTT